MVVACSRPALSLSGRTTTRLPRRCSEYSSRHFPAPNGLHVAVSPNPSAACTHFSPSTTNTHVAVTTLGSR